jgi:hypothetical protein
MPNSGLAEIYFIAAMFILIFLICGVSVFFFFRTLKREKQEKEAAKRGKSIRHPKSEIQN